MNRRQADFLSVGGGGHGRGRVCKSPFQKILFCGHCGGPIRATYTAKPNGRQYAYYLCMKDYKRAKSICRKILILGFFIKLLIQKVEVREDGIDIEFKADAITSLVAELTAAQEK